MDPLNIVLNELISDIKFTTDYDIKMETTLGSTFVRVTRKEKPISEKYVYSTSIGVDYQNNFCFDIYHTSDMYIFNTLRILPCKYDKDAKYQFGFEFGIKEPIYTQTITYGGFNYETIKEYIINTEFQLLNKRINDMDFLAVNEWRCPKCKCKMTM